MEVFLLLAYGLLLKSWGHADSDITCTNVKYAGLIIERLKLVSVSEVLEEEKSPDINSKSKVCRVFPIVFSD